MASSGSYGLRWLVTSARRTVGLQASKQGGKARGNGTKGGSGPPGGFWSEGTKEKSDGLLFGETPPPPGQARKWESWEAPWYATLVGSFVLLTLGLSAKPDNGITTWAREEAMERRYGPPPSAGTDAE